MTYTLTLATLADAHELVPRLRAADRQEVIALGLDPLEGLAESLRAGEAWTVRADGAILCMTGVGALTAIGQTGVPWLVGSDLVKRHARHFLRESRRFVGEWLNVYPILQNRVPPSYKATLRWAKWLGFRVEEGSPFCTIRLEAPWHGVHQTTIPELWRHDNFQNLLEEYADESAVLDPALRPAAKLETYARLEASGMLHTFQALRYGRLVGFATVLSPVLPHYERVIAVTESLFVARRYRRGGPGLRLLRRAEECARDLGSPGLIVTAPFEGALFHLLPRAGYAETNRVFFKGLAP